MNIERSIKDTSVNICPTCKSRDNLVVLIDDSFSIGCKKCKKYFVTAMNKCHYAHAEWEKYAVDGLKKAGVDIKNIELYNILIDEFDRRKQLNVIEDKKQKYLNINALSNCPFKVDEHFLSNLISPPGMNGIWLVEEIKGLFDWEKGPFWAIYAQGISFTGKRLDIKKSFMQIHIDEKKLEPYEPFYQARKWNQLVLGDVCVYNEETGVIGTVEQTKHSVDIVVGEDKYNLKILKGISIHFNRIDTLE